MRLIFMGTPQFAVPSLERLAESGYVPVGVATGPDRPRGRGQQVTPTPVKKAAQQLGLRPILQPESVRDPAFAEAVRDLEPDVIVVVAFKILPPEVYEAARLGAFNLHGSLLPKYRGAAPINRAVMAGETKTGVTTFFLERTVDTGNIVLQKEMPIGPDDTAGEVHDRMMVLGAEAVVETVSRIESGTVDPRPQDDALATPAPKIFRDDARIPWGEPAEVVHNHIRGLSPYPGAWTHHEKTLIKVYRSRVSSGKGDSGEVLAADERLVVACGQGAVELMQVQQQGRKRLSSSDFLRGYELSAGARLV